MERGRLSGPDALRGAAAIVVMMHHYFSQLAGINLLPAGHLAVDFFFMLSGFVIDRAYRDRLLQSYDFGLFARARLARLYPTMAIGILLGAGVALRWHISTQEWAIRLLAQLAFVPLPSGGVGALYVLNGVQWSLALELIANAFHGLLFYRLSNRTLALVVGTAFVCLLAVTWVNGNLGGDTNANWWCGPPRLISAYTIGVLLNRLSAKNLLPKMAVPTAIPVTLLLVVIVNVGPFINQWWVGPATTLALVPILVLSIESTTTHLRIVAAFAALSYPLYAIHIPVMNLAYTLSFTEPWQRFIFAMVVTPPVATGIYLLTRTRRQGQPALPAAT